MMINHQHRQPGGSILAYSDYHHAAAAAAKRATLLPHEPGARMLPSGMYSIPVAGSQYTPAMSMQMYALPEYASAASVQQQHVPLRQQPVSAATAYLGQNFRRAEQQQQHAPSPTQLSFSSNSAVHHQTHQLHPLAHSVPHNARGSLAVGQHQEHRHHALRHSQYTAMAAGNGFTPQMSDEDLVEMQKLSEGWEPEVRGPLVGERQASTAIAEEYATADPIYQQKTAALPRSFSHYRTVRGDGRCGWRAVGFGFLEKLIAGNDENKLFEQIARLKSLSNVINAAGFAPMVYEDFADEMLDFMRKLGEATKAGNAESVLLEGFNDEGIQSAIITHLRTLTASWMKTHIEEYDNFLPDQGVHRYCDENILPYGSEIDHVGLNALHDVLLAPANIALEVLYLDLSPGPEVNLHNFCAQDQLPFKESCIRLLYRPGHFDLLYKQEDIPQPPIATYLQLSTQTFNEPIFDVPTADFMTLIPGMSMPTQRHGWLSTNGYGGVCDFFPTPTPVQPCVAALPAAAAAVSASSGPTMLPQQSTFVTQLPPTQLTQDLPLRPAQQIKLETDWPQLGSGTPFRASTWMRGRDVAQATSQMPLQTSIFRNSHFNTAHFLNPDFQPEEWSPDAEYVTTGSKQKARQSG